MLYVSTRSKTDSFTAYRALHEDRAPDGGLYLPMRMPGLNQEQLREMTGKGFFDNVAKILTLFFPVQLSPWDVRVCFGSEPVHLAVIGRKVAISEYFHSSDGRYESAVQRLYEKIAGEQGRLKKPSTWAVLAIKIATVFGVFCNLPARWGRPVDIAVPTGDFTDPMAVWYAREMGLPVGNILCACNENGAVWELVRRGEFNTGVSCVSTRTPALDHAVPAGLEWLIYCTLGPQETRRYVQCCQTRSIYKLQEEQYGRLKTGLAASVVGSGRLGTVISSAWITSGYIMDPHTAICYGGLQDFRAATAEARQTVILCAENPVFHLDLIAEATGMGMMDLKSRIQRQ